MWTALAVGGLLAAFILVLATRPAAETVKAHSPLLGKPAPELAGTTIDGQHIRLGNYEGRWVLVNFFATWCIPCRKEHPELIRFATRHAAVGDAAVVAVIFDDSSDAVREFRRDHGGDWPMVLDRDGAIAVDFGVSGVPESFLISPDGFVVSKLLGGVTGDRLEQLLSDAKAQTSHS